MTNFDQQLTTYAQLIVRTGLNLQPGQRLLINTKGSTLSLAPLIRRVATQAYEMGAYFVDVIWADEELERIRYQNAPKESFSEYPDWRFRGALDFAKRGDAMLTILAANPDALSGVDAQLITQTENILAHHRGPLRQETGKGRVNWCVAAAPAPGWASKVFPAIDDREQRINQLWQAIFDICRLSASDPLAAWERHISNLVTRRQYLTDKGYDLLHFTGPGTDLKLGLPAGHIWQGGRSLTQQGTHYTPNLPTEEVFSLPDRSRADGHVTTTKPLSLMGNLIPKFTLTFKDGGVTKVSADQGQNFLEKLISTDDGARHLGEVALVPHSSPISQSGLLFYNTLFDENAASHVALGNAYKMCLEGGIHMDDEQFAAVGGNNSLIHVDFMLGSGDINVDGITPDGTTEPIMRDGEWAFDV
ncbi:MAG TPA: aminopeptidase [Anaerolineae bacterium]|nr:aminopeptidase [Anaerolineae bacterium]